MTRIVLPALAASLLAAAAIGTAQASPAAPGAMDPAIGTLGLTQDVQYSWGGRSYCFYPDGWHGPGFYRCGFSHRHGLGWGGPVGWHGWREGRGYERRDTTGAGVREGYRERPSGHSGGGPTGSVGAPNEAGPRGQPQPAR